MQTKLTLRMDSALIVRAKKWAHSRGISLSQLIANIFEHMTAESRSEQNEPSPWVKTLVIKKSPFQNLTDQEIKSMRYVDLEKKHR